jgi:lysophospholipase L1-like esterase
MAVAIAGCQPAPAAASRDARAESSATTAHDWTGSRAHGAPTPLALSTGAALAQALPRDTWVLHIGDSFVDASFQQNLRPHFRETGTTYVSTGVTATYTTTWAFDPALDRWLAKRPAMVIITLGANEVDMPFPSEHAKAIAAIVRKIGRAGASCVWTTPPLWKPDTGILQVIHEHAAPCLFFDSDAVIGRLSLAERNPDRIHPNAKGGGRWADAFWRWLEAHRDPNRGPWSLRPFEPRDR